MSCLNIFRSIFQKKFNFYVTLWRYFAGELFWPLKFISCQINGYLEPLKGIGINFWVISPSDIFIHILDNDLTRGRPLETPQKPCLNSWLESDTAFRVLYWWRQQCKQISNGHLEIFKKIITLLTITLFFLCTFLNLILDATCMFQF